MDGEPATHVRAAVAGQGVEGAERVELEDSPMASDLLSAGDADAVHKSQSTIAALQGTIEGLRAIGSVRGVQCIEAELTKERRKLRKLSKSRQQSRMLSCGCAGPKTRTDA